MTRNFARMSDHLELSAPVAVGMIVIVAVLAKGGHSFWAIGSIVAIHALSIVATCALARLDDQCTETESAPAATQSGLWLVSTEPVTTPSLAAPVPRRDPEPSAAPQAPLRHAA